MSDKSTKQGKAYEYAVCLAIREAVSTVRPVELSDSSSMKIAETRFTNDMSKDIQSRMLLSAEAGIREICSNEPFMMAKSQSPLKVSIQSDLTGISGDVRDVILSVPGEKWQIGISVKHNHDALKHSRLSSNIDFGNEWYDIPVSTSYWKSTSPIFSELSGLKAKSVPWSSLKNKSDKVYLPLLESFLSEIRAASSSSIQPFITGLFRYLLGSHDHDYYKLVQVQNKKVTKVSEFNFNDGLHRGGAKIKEFASEARLKLPSRLISCGLKANSKTTAILEFDEGWSFSFRIHSASTIAEPSLKFDVQLLSQPKALPTKSIPWI